MVHCDFTSSMNDAVAHGIRISQIFKKELCLFHAYGVGGKEAKQDAQRNLGLIIRRLKEDMPALPISSLTLKGSLENCIVRIAEEYDGILMVLSNDQLKPKIKALQQSQIPFLFVGASMVETLNYKQVLLPVDFRKVMKDTALWASYFARFNQATVDVFSAKESNKEEQRMVNGNNRFIEQLFAKFQLKPRFEQATKSSFGLSGEALTKGKDGSHDLLIMPASQHVSLIDLLLGLPEGKLIKKAGNLSVMCINPKRDMYILCD